MKSNVFAVASVSLLLTSKGQRLPNAMHPDGVRGNYFLLPQNLLAYKAGSWGFPASEGPKLHSVCAALRPISRKQS